MASVPSLSSDRWPLLIITSIGSFYIVVVEVGINIVLVVHPGLNLVGVLLVEVAGGGGGVDEVVLGVEANIVGLEGVIAPKHHLTPQVGVCSTLVHSNIWFEVHLNEMLVLVEHSVHLLGCGLWVLKYLVEVSPHSILLIMESIDVHSLDGVHMLRHQLSEHTPI